jgi:hypothetical protein
MNTFDLLRTFTVCDACDLCTGHTQIVKVADTKNPSFVEALPQDETVECGDVLQAAVLTGVDNCGTPVNVTVSTSR